jgi:hypothetical protein
MRADHMRRHEGATNTQRKEARMSIIYTCNFCGETIGQNAPFVALNGNGDRADGHWRTGYVGHYHADLENGCWTRILEVIRAADEWGPRLEGIPTASPQLIAARRRQHRQVDEPTP